MRATRHWAFAGLLVLGLLVGYASAAASDGGTTTTTETTATTAPPPPPVATTTVVTTTAPAPPATVPPSSTAAAVKPARAVARDLDRGCLVVGAVALRLPGRHLPLVLGPVAHAPWVKHPTGSSLLYPADGSVVSAGAVTAGASRCVAVGNAEGAASVTSLSLFDGAVSADAVSLRIARGAVGGTSAVTGLRVDGKPIATPAAGQRVRIGAWGYLEVLRNRSVSVGDERRLRATGLVVHLRVRHGGLRAGTDVLVSFADLALPALPKKAPAPKKTPKPKKTPEPGSRKREPGSRIAARRPHRAAHQPLTVTPKLGRGRFVFPVAGRSSWGDTYGGLRSDVPGNWHHGDDIFAPLGTPVVAVATGTLNRVGWQRLGGWRLWVRDRNGDQFYYAHLSGYTPLALHSKNVRAGQVIGFVGNSGDAFTTPAHLHFEVHPRKLLRLKYDGAVNPTSYLAAWDALERVAAPAPVVPPIPRQSQAVKREASFIFRELLSKRGLLSSKKAHVAPPSRRHKPAAPKKAGLRRAVAAISPGGRGSDPYALGLLVLLLATGLAGATLIARSYRIRTRAFKD